MSDAPITTPVKPLKEVRKEHILHVLQSADGDLDRASRILGISAASLRRKIRQYGISDDQVRKQGEE
jgi:sigma-54 dependent transcriptional regulator, acetoin dehydrogenase operon transcriptional activator AcoR